jgi:hypothetical protein
MQRQVDRRQLSRADLAAARRLYAQLYARAMPHAGGIDPARIEVAAFNLAGSLAEFRNVGLGLEVVTVFRDADGTGHTGKVLMNLPGQLLPEHGHVDTFVLRRAAQLPKGFVPMKDRINAFQGICRYNRDGSVVKRRGLPQYAYRDGNYRIVQAADGVAPLPCTSHKDVVAAFSGKSETFKAVYGDGVLLTDKAVVLYAPKGAGAARLPRVFRIAVDRVRQTHVITTRRCIYMAPGTIVLLPKCTKHAFLAGNRGAVYLEFSTPSMDEADRFSDPRVIR